MTFSKRVGNSEEGEEGFGASSERDFIGSIEGREVEGGKIVKEESKIGLATVIVVVVFKEERDGEGN